MPVIAIAVDEIVFAFLEDGGDTDRDGFLAAIEVAESADALAGLGVFLIGAFFEAADEHHHPQALALVLSADGRSYLKSRWLLNFVDYGHVVALQSSALFSFGSQTEKF